MIVKVFPSPLHRDPVAIDFPDGLKIGDIVESLKPVEIVRAEWSGAVIEPADWMEFHCGEGVLVLYARPGNLGKILAVVAVIGIVAAAGPLGAAAAGGIGFAAGSAGFAITSAVASAAFSAVGNLVVQSLFGPSRSNIDDAAQADSFSVGLVQNRARRGEPIPLILGRVRAAPDLMAEQIPFTKDREQYLDAPFCHGYGPLAISDLRIGNTALAVYDDEAEVDSDGNTSLSEHDLYNRDISPDFFSLAVEPDTDIIRTTAVNTRRVFLDFSAPSGIFEVTKKGKYKNYPIDIKIDYREVGETEWTLHDADYRIASRKRDAIVQSASFALPAPGQYEIRIRRTTADEGDVDSSTYQSDLTLTALRSVQKGDPFNVDYPVAATFLRLRATGRLNGPVDTLTALVASIGKKWDQATNAWIDDQEINNPADLVRLVYQHPANPKAVSDAEIDLPALQAWSEYCSDKGWTFNQRRDSVTSFDDVIRDICAAGRAVPVKVNGKYSVAYDDDGQAVSHHFTPQNSWGFSAQHSYPEPPHALRVKFFDEDNDYSAQERVVYSSGYNAANATLFETLSLPGVTNADHIWKFGRYYLNEQILRPETISLNCSWQSVDLHYGDRVSVSHNVISVGSATGRVKSVSGLDVTLDAPVSMEEGEDYGLRYALSDGTVVTRAVATEAGSRDVITLEGAGTPPAVETAFGFGPIASVSEEFRVRGIKRLGDFDAQIEMVNHDAAITDDDAATPDAWAPNTTSQAIVNPLTYAPRGGGFSERVEVISGEDVAIVSLSWSAPEYGPVLGYTIVKVDAEGREGVGEVAGDITAIEVRGLLPGSYTFEIRARFADVSVASDALSIAGVVTGDKTRLQVPEAPTGLSATGGVGRIAVSWDRPEITDLDYVEVFKHTSSTFSGASLLARTQAAQVIDDALGVSATRYYWARTVTTAAVDNVSDWSGPVTATSTGVTSTLLEDDSVVIAKLAGDVTDYIDDADAVNAASIIAEAADRTSGDATNAASIISEAASRASGDAANASDISTLFSETAANAAAIVSEATTRASADSAEASARTALASDVSDNAAAIVTEASTRATADTALASDITTLFSEASDNAAAIVSEATTRASADSAEAAARTALASDVSDNTSAISAEATTRAAADSALASDITSLTATVSGNTASITSEAAARIAADGTITAEHTVTFDVNGRVTGYGFIAGAKFSEFGVRTDRFTVARPDGTGSKSVFVIGQVDGVDEVAISGNLIVDGTIVGRHVATETLSSDHIEAGSIDADRLKVGTGGNLLANTDFSDGLFGWEFTRTAPSATEQTTMGLRAAGATYSGEFNPVLVLYQDGTAGNETGEVRNVHSTVEGADASGVPVQAGQWIEASAHIATLGCAGDLDIIFRDSDGAAISTAALIDGDSGLQGGSDDDPETWPIYWGVAQAPSGTAFAQLRILKRATISPSTVSLLVIHKPQLIVSHEHAQAPAPYSPGGVTLIGGGRIKTDAVTADKIVAGAIVAGKIAANAVTANKIVAGGIVAGKIAANAVTATEADFTSLSALSLTVGSLDIDGSAVTNPKIDDEAVSRSDFASSTANSSPGAYDTNTWGTYLSDVFNAGHAGRLHVYAPLRFVFSGEAVDWRIRLTVDDVAMSFSGRTDSGGLVDQHTMSSIQVAAGNHTVKLEVQCDNDVSVTQGALIMWILKK